jgi:hypothetical protein
MSREISLTQGKVAIVDDADYDVVSAMSWHITRCGKYIYPATRIAGDRGLGAVRMHNLLLAAPPGLLIDHKNGDTLDNRRCNLRLSSMAQNAWSRHTGGRGASRFVGVCRAKNRWRARIRHIDVRIEIGYFKREVDAAIAYDEKCRELRGEFARPNFSLTLAERKLRDWVSRTGGRFFSICFIKRTDGSERVMLCRTGVTPLPGPSIIEITESKDLLSVWDVQKREFRFVPLEGILWIRYNNMYIRPLRPRRAALDVTAQGLLFAQTAG